MFLRNISTSPSLSFYSYNSCGNHLPGVKWVAVKKLTLGPFEDLIPAFPDSIPGALVDPANNVERLARKANLFLT